MTDKEKLQRLFNAALKDSSEISGRPKEAFPTASRPTPSPAEVASTQAAPARQLEAIAPCGEAVADEAPRGQPQPVVLDDAASAELGALLDERHRRQKRKARIAAAITAGVFLTFAGGGSAWFVQSPERMQAFHEAMRDIRSAGDVKGLVAKYQDALDRISARSQQIDQATAAMGVKPGSADDEDPYFEAEMKEMMGGEGRTVGQRNRDLQKNFSHMEKKEGKALASAKSPSEEDSFNW